jgi:hypothetical protein
MRSIWQYLPVGASVALTSHSAARLGKDGFAALVCPLERLLVGYELILAADNRKHATGGAVDRTSTISRGQVCRMQEEVTEEVTVFFDAHVRAQVWVLRESVTGVRYQ